MNITLDIFEFRNKFRYVHFAYLCTYKYSFERWNVIDDRLSGHLGCLHQKCTHINTVHVKCHHHQQQKQRQQKQQQHQQHREKNLKQTHICSMRAQQPNMQTHSHGFSCVNAKRKEKQNENKSKI